MNIGPIEGVSITVDGIVIRYLAKAAIDSDGSDNRHHDPCWQAETTLTYDGKPIDAEAVPYVVAPPQIPLAVVPKVLGSLCRVTNTLSGKSALAVVADIGPHGKIGEMSCECARRIGLDGNPNHGGTDSHIIQYEITAGQAATIDGITYNLQAFHGR